MRTDIDVPESATPEEAAAITAAIGAYLDTEGEFAGAGEDADDDWKRDRWRFRGRIEALQSRSVRIPADAPTDPWRATGRTEWFPK